MLTSGWSTGGQPPARGGGGPEHAARLLAVRQTRVPHRGRQARGRQRGWHQVAKTKAIIQFCTKIFVPIIQVLRVLGAAGATAPDAAGQAAAGQEHGGDPGALRQVQRGGQRVLLRPTPAQLRRRHQLLPDGSSSPRRGGLPGGLQAGPGVLGHRRAVPG